MTKKKKKKEDLLLDLGMDLVKNQFFSVFARSSLLSKVVPDRMRKLLMKGLGYTLIPLDLHGTKSASRSKFFLFSMIPHG